MRCQINVSALQFSKKILADKHENRCGGSIGKLVGLNSEIQNNPVINSSRSFPFLLLDGLITDLTPWMQCGGHGTVSGIPNFAPKASMRLWDLLNRSSLTVEETK